MGAKSWCVLVVVLAALGLAGQAGAANVVVWAGPGFLKAAPAGAPKTADANLFFPQRVLVHVGDTVTFKSQSFHTATYLGTHKAGEFPRGTELERHGSGAREAVAVRHVRREIACVASRLAARQLVGALL